MLEGLRSQGMLAWLLVVELNLSMIGFFQILPLVALLDRERSHSPCII